MTPKMKKKIMIILLIILLFFLISLIFYEPKVKTNFVKNLTVEKTEDLFFVYETVMYPSNVEIIKLGKDRSNISVGITGEPWNLNFGFVPIGVESRRFINLANYKEEKYKVEIQAYGNISPIISFDKNNFVLNKGDELKITVLLNSTLSTKTGNFTGEIDIVSKGAKFQFLEMFL
jgi:hypothetical protein